MMKSNKKTKNSEWWVREYAEDVHAYWRRRETQLPQFHSQSPQLIYRKSLIDYMSQICNRLHFCTRVKHLAIYYLDSFMDHHSIEDHLQLVTMCCIIVAVKVDEQDSLIPRISEYAYLLYNKYSIDVLIDMEVTIMQFLKWELLVPTAAAFTEYYVLHAIRSADRYEKAPLQSIQQAQSYLQQYVDFFLELSLQDHSFREYLPSVVASAVIAASRFCLQIKPTWPLHLKKVTGYHADDIRHCFSKMIALVRSELSPESLKSYSRLVDDENCGNQNIECHESDNESDMSDNDTTVNTESDDEVVILEDKHPKRIRVR